MRWQRLQALPGLHVPQPHGFIEGSGHNYVALGIEVHTEDVVGVSLKGFHAIPSLQVPDLESFVIRGGADIPGIRAPSEV